MSAGADHGRVCPDPGVLGVHDEAPQSGCLGERHPSLAQQPGATAGSATTNRLPPKPFPSIQILPPNEVIVLISFEITMGEMRGIMNLCIPYNTIEPLAGKLSANTWSSYHQMQADPRQIVHLETSLGKAPVDMIICLAGKRV
mgnify:CR=1 FL=1